VSETERRARIHFGTGGDLPADRRRRSTRTCALGCGGLLLIVLVGIGYWIYQNVQFVLENTAEAPLDFALPAVAAADAARGEQKAERLRTGETNEALFTAGELNAFLQKGLQQVPAAAEARVRVDFQPGDRIRIRSTSVLDIRFVGKRYANLDYLGRLDVKDGALSLSDVERFVVGEKDRRGDVEEILEEMRSELELLRTLKKGPHDDVARAFERIESLRLEGGRLHVKLKPAAPAAPEGQER
jgi:hypothetical protein